MGDDHIEAVKEWPVPFSNKDPRIVAPLYRVTGKKVLFVNLSSKKP